MWKSLCDLENEQPEAFGYFLTVLGPGVDFTLGKLGRAQVEIWGSSGAEDLV